MKPIAEAPRWWARYLWRRINEGECIPWWMGIAWRNWLWPGVRARVLPANLLLRIGWMLYSWMKHPLRFFDAEWEATHWRREAQRWEGIARDMKDRLDWTLSARGDHA